MTQPLPTPADPPEHVTIRFSCGHTWKILCPKPGRGTSDEICHRCYRERHGDTRRPMVKVRTISGAGAPAMLEDVTP